MFKQLFSWLTAPAALQTPCFHCGAAVLLAVECEFAGQPRTLCCHGCRAVLLAIQQAGYTEDYLAQKAPAQVAA